VPLCGIIPLAGRVLPGARLRQRSAAFCVLGEDFNLLVEVWCRFAASSRLRGESFQVHN